MQLHYHEMLDTLLARGELGPHQTCLLTSPTPRAGTTTTVLGLCDALASRGRRVLVIDANLRGPALHVHAARPLQPGLAEWLRGPSASERPWQAIDQSGVSKMLLPAGTSGADTYDLLASPRWKELLAAAAHEFDTVLIDSPALETSGDALLLAPTVDCVLLVIAGGKTRQRAAVKAKADLARVGGKLQGVILSRAVDPIPSVLRRFI